MWIIFLSPNHTISFKVSIGHATNKFNELLSLKLVFILALEKGVTQIQIWSDSLLVIQWMKTDSTLEEFYALAIILGPQTCKQLSLTFPSHMSIGTKVQKQASFPKKEWSCTKEPARSLNPIKDNILLIFMKLGFNLFSFLSLWNYEQMI